MEPLKVGDVVRRTEGAESTRLGKIVKFTMQGAVKLAWVEWVYDKPVLPDPSPEPVDVLERVSTE